jgi:hypothetical protein
VNPDDLAHADDLAYALPLVSYRDPDGLTVSSDLFRAVVACLEAAGRPGMPIGAFNRLMSAAGHPRKRMRVPGVPEHRVFPGFNLRDDYL